MMNDEGRGKVSQRPGLVMKGPRDRKLCAPANRRPGPHLNRSAAETPEESGPDKFG